MFFDKNTPTTQIDEVEHIAHICWVFLIEFIEKINIKDKVTTKNKKLFFEIFDTRIVFENIIPNRFRSWSFMLAGELTAS